MEGRETTSSKKNNVAGSSVSSASNSHINPDMSSIQRQLDNKKDKSDELNGNSFSLSVSMCILYLYVFFFVFGLISDSMCIYGRNSLSLYRFNHFRRLNTNTHTRNELHNIKLKLCVYLCVELYQVK